MEINCDLGEVILEAFPETKVDVHHPDVMLNVEIRNEIYVYSQIIPGAGGMPVGTNGKAMLLLSGGIDSPVAGYMISKRGVGIELRISMRRRIQASAPSRKWWIWPGSYPDIPGP